jgi:hypothetical protein
MRRAVILVRPGWRSIVAVAVALAPAAAHAAPAPAVIAKCGDSAIEVTPGPDGGTATLHGVVVAGGERWGFTASVGMARLGAKTRTVAVESVTTVEGTPARGKRAALHDAETRTRACYAKIMPRP